MGKWLSISLGLFFGVASAAAQAVSVESKTWRLKFDNDAFFDKDNKISSGWSLQAHSAVATRWQALGDIGRWGELIPTLTKDGLACRAGVAASQLVQTPTDLSRSDLIEEDVPYAGAFTLQAVWYAFNDDSFRGFGLTTGVVGPFSFSQQPQEMIHNLIGSEAPQGWDNQLDTEFVINTNYMQKEKFWRGGHPEGLLFDVAISGNVGLGNLFTQLSAALEMRLGYNMPRGFVHVPDPVGFNMPYLAALKPVSSQQASVYASLVLDSSVFAHNIFLDGNSYRTSHSVDKKPLLGLVIVGVHYEKPGWGAHFSLMMSSDNVNSQNTAVSQGERLGSIGIEWRF